LEAKPPHAPLPENFYAHETLSPGRTVVELQAVVVNRTVILDNNNAQKCPVLRLSLDAMRLENNFAKVL